jgi:hypothetical protein
MSNFKGTVSLDFHGLKVVSTAKPKLGQTAPDIEKTTIARHSCLEGLGEVSSSSEDNH